MKQIISRCGNICSECPWSNFMRQKIKEENWEEYSNKVKKYTGYKPIKYEWEGCIGCLTPNKKLPKHPFFNFLRKCRTRKCTSYNEIYNCAYCTRFSCENTVANNNFTRENLSKKLGGSIDDTTYDHYIKMFDSMTTLKKIRNNLPKDQVKNPKPISKNIGIIKLKGEFKKQNYIRIYEKLFEIAHSDLGIIGIDTVSGLENYMSRKDVFWRLLWIFGLYGNISNNDLIIDSATIYENRKPISLPSNEDEWKKYFDIFAEFGIKIKLEIKTDKLYTPGGYMRALIPISKKPAYILNMNYSPTQFAYHFFKVLHEILTELQNKTGRRAFTNFKKLNFNSLLS